MRDWLTRPLTVVGIALAIVGVLFLLMEAQSPSRLYWTGQAVAGTNSQGIVYYRVGGEQYTVDDTGPVPAHPTPVTVYVDPADPSQALLLKPTRWIDAVGVLVWFVAAGVCLMVSAIGGARRRRKRAELAHQGSGYGGGLDSDWISHHLERSQRRSRER